jgi:hypothetical protein
MSGNIGVGRAARPLVTFAISATSFTWLQPATMDEQCGKKNDQQSCPMFQSRPA